MKERSDEELLDSLYGERADRLDEQARGPARSDEDDDLAQLRRLRGVFAELRANQEEPPPSGMALLMAAARQAAEERKPKQEGLWARLRAGWHAMVAHPAMAAAAAAVVVIGASGYLMSRGVKTAESTYSSSESAPAGHFDEKSAEPVGNRSMSAPSAAPAAPALAEPAPDPAAGAAPEAPAAKLEMATGTATGTSAPADGEAARDRRQAPLKKAKPMAPPREEVGGLVEGGSSGAGSDKGNRLDDSYAKQNPGAISGGGGSSAGKAPRPTTSAPPPPPPPPAAQAAAPEPTQESESAADSDSAADSKDEAKKKSGVESITQQSERWYQLARDAAAKGDCNAVRLLAERVQSENPGFYAKRFKKDAAISKCL